MPPHTTETVAYQATNSLNISSRPPMLADGLECNKSLPCSLEPTGYKHDIN